MDDDLTYEQMYDIDLTVRYNHAQIEYAGCGTHQIEVAGKIELSEARRLHQLLSDLPGIKGGTK